MTTDKKQDGAALYRSLKKQEAHDDLDEIDAMSDDELDHYIASNGGDPKAIRESGEAHVKALLGRRITSQETMAAKLESFRAQAAAQTRGPRLPRAELLSRLEVARNDPRFTTPVAMLFRKKTAEASTDEELRTLVDAIELLSKLEQG